MSIDVTLDPSSSGESSVSWGAIWVGAAAAAAITLTMLVLATGLGLTLVSPWASQNASGTTFAISSAIGFVVVQWASAGVGGYLAGRLRPNWADVDSDERFFRDTAHGFAVWCVGTILVAALAFASAASVARGAGDLAKTAASAAQGVSEASGVQDYASDLLFRGGANPPAPERRAEAARIVAMDVARGEFPAGDRAYLAQLVSAASGLSPDDARARVDQAIATLDQAKTRARQAAEEARKAASRAALFAYLALLIGAFIGSAAAAYGGSHRDVVEA